MTTLSVPGSNATVADDKTFKYNFYSTSVIQRLGNVSYVSGSYLEIQNFSFMNNIYHVIHDLQKTGTNQSFVAKRARVLKNYHEFTDLSTQGELVVEAVALDNSAITYVVIPLSTTKYTSDNELDDLIQYYTGSDTNVNLSKLNINELIPVATLDSFSRGGSSSTTSFVANSYKLSNSSDGNLTGLFSTSITASVIHVVVLEIAIPISTSTATAIQSWSNMYTSESSAATLAPASSVEIRRSIPVTTPSAITSDDIYIDCSPEAENGDAAAAQNLKTKRRFYLTDRDVSDLCIAFLTGLTWVVSWYIANEIFSKLDKNNNPMRKVFNALSNLLGRVYWNFSNDPIKKRGLAPGNTIILLLFIITVSLFWYAFAKKQVRSFKGSIYIFTTMICLLYCSYLPIFNTKDSTPSAAAAAPISAY